jgi:hypothetical protein
VLIINQTPASKKSAIGAPSKGRPEAENPAKAAGDVSMQVNELWLEYGHFTDSDSLADRQGYVHSSAMLEWSPADRWNMQIEGRVDGYYQSGALDANATVLDYGETFVRYTGQNTRITVGAQKVFWGRIDEFPPTDRLSTQDLSRFVLDDLADRRRASTAIRVEYNTSSSKLDLLLIPFFREAELPEKDSVWFPVNRSSGQVLGLETTALTSTVVKNASIDLDAPNSDGGAGIRYSGLSADVDYGVTVQRGRQSIPYFIYDSDQNTLETYYPRTWVVGGDLGFEAMSGTLRFEASWLSDTPVTSLTNVVSTVDSVSWGAAFEFFPGDRDARINLQVIGNKLFDAGNVLDRTEVYSFGGSLEAPFANETWRVNARFQIGLDEYDVYINPEIAYTGWSSQEIYIEAHYFDGSNGTPGGFHQDNSLIAIGWRRKF